VKKEIGLTDAQAVKIDALYEHRVKDVDPFVQEFLKQKDELDRLVRERVVDVPTIQLQFGRMETAWAKLRESRTVMLYRIYLLLTPDQYKKLQAIQERENRGRRGGGLPHL
jgi:Spy/CpxP family protein refolding chaperone